MGTASLRNCPAISSKVLKAAGFDAAKIKSIESSFPDVFDIRSAFTPSILGEEFCTETLDVVWVAHRTRCARIPTNWPNASEEVEVLAECDVETVPSTTEKVRSSPFTIATVSPSVTSAA